MSDVVAAAVRSEHWKGYMSTGTIIVQKNKTHFFAAFVFILATAVPLLFFCFLEAWYPLNAFAVECMLQQGLLYFLSLWQPSNARCNKNDIKFANLTRV